MEQLKRLWAWGKQQRKRSRKSRVTDAPTTAPTSFSDGLVENRSLPEPQPQSMSIHQLDGQTPDERFTRKPRRPTLTDQGAMNQSSSTGQGGASSAPFTEPQPPGSFTRFVRRRATTDGVPAPLPQPMRPPHLRALSVEDSRKAIKRFVSSADIARANRPGIDAIGTWNAILEGRGLLNPQQERQLKEMDKTAESSAQNEAIQRIQSREEQGGPSKPPPSQTNPRSSQDGADKKRSSTSSSKGR